MHIESHCTRTAIIVETASKCTSPLISTYKLAMSSAAVVVVSVSFMMLVLLTTEKGVAVEVMVATVLLVLQSLALGRYHSLKSI